MRPEYKFYLKTFLKLTIISLPIIFLFNLFIGYSTGTLQLVLWVLFWSSLMTLTMGRHQVKMIKNLTKGEPTENDLSIRQTTTLSFGQLPADALSSIEKVLLEDKHCSLLAKDELNNVIEFKTKAKYKLNGAERIRIALVDDGHSGTEVKIESKPTRFYMFLDEARNKTNIIEVENRLKRVFGSIQPIIA